MRIVDFSKPLVHFQGADVPVTYVGKQAQRDGKPITDGYDELLICGRSRAASYVDKFGRTKTAEGSKTAFKRIVKNVGGEDDSPDIPADILPQIADLKALIIDTAKQLKEDIAAAVLLITEALPKPVPAPPHRPVRVAGFAKLGAAVADAVLKAELPREAEIKGAEMFARQIVLNALSAVARIDGVTKIVISEEHERTSPQRRGALKFVNDEANCVVLKAYGDEQCRRVYVYCRDDARAAVKAETSD